MHGRSNSAPWNCRTISSHAATSAEVSTCGRRLSEAGTGAAPDRTIPRSASTSGPRVEQVGELRLDARRLVQEGQRPAVGGQCVGQALAVAPGLRLDAGERPARLLGLDRAGGRAIDVQEIVNGTALQRKLAHGDARSGCEICGGAVLHDPAGIGQLAVDPLAGSGFRLGGQSLSRVPSQAPQHDRPFGADAHHGDRRRAPARNGPARWRSGRDYIGAVIATRCDRSYREPRP